MRSNEVALILKANHRLRDYQRLYRISFAVDNESTRWLGFEIDYSMKRVAFEIFKFCNATSKKSTYFQQLEPSTLQVEILASNSQQFFVKKQVGERRGNKSRGPAGLSFAGNYFARREAEGTRENPEICG